MRKTTVPNIQTNPRVFRRNLRTVFAFEGIFKLITIVFAVPLFSGLERFAMKLAGYRYLTAENIYAFFRHPLIWVSSALLLLLILLYILFDFSAVLFNLHLAYWGKSTDIFHTVHFALRSTLSFLRQPGKRFLILLILPLFPFFLLGIAPWAVSNLLFKDIILKKIQRDPFFALGSIGLFVLLLALFLHLMYICQFAVLEKCETKSAITGSLTLGHGRHFYDLIRFLHVQISCYLIYAILLGFAMFIAMLFEKVLFPMRLVNPISTSLLLTISTVSLCLLACWTMPACFISIGMLYYRHKQEKGEVIPPCEAVDLPVNARLLAGFHRWKTIVSALVLAASILVCGLYIYLTYKGRFNPRIEYVHHTEITAHRGGSRYYPENTMAAFKCAADQGADWIELDIHQSKDGVLFAMHDDTLYRTCKVRGYCWNYTWEELSAMDAGSFFKSHLANEPIPSLSDVLDFALEKDVRLNIELKPSPHENGMEERLVSLLEEKDFIDHCVVTSQKYRTISRIKELNPDISTVYVMGYAYGNVNALSAADNFSINKSSISGKLVSDVHNAGKQIYVWTVNSRTFIEDMMDRNVDNIITDDVPLAQKIVGEKRTSTALYEYIRFLHRIFSFG